MVRAIQGGLVQAVDAGSIAERAGICAGDQILSVNGNDLHDVFDWLWYSDADQLELTMLDEEVERVLKLSRADDEEEWGIEFADMLFDGIRTCANACAFCFMDQLPKGLRSSLYLKDDDYRLSFYEGNFITLTNMTDADIARIIEQHISPLYVSLHAADPDVRTRLMGPAQGRALEVFEELVALGIELHVSIVLVPGINDGTVLDNTLEYLEEYRSQILSVGIVPVAYTKFTIDIAGKPPQSFDEREAAARVISQVQTYQFRSREETGRTWVYLADEFYIYAHAPFPTTEWYDDYPQYENGIGIVHTYIEGIREHYDALSVALATLPNECEKLTIVTGELTIETMLGTLSALHAGGKTRLLPVKNEFFGGNINVTGLLTGTDVVHSIRYDDQHFEGETTYVIPWSIFNDDDLTLDGYSPEMIAEAIEAAAIIVSDDAEGLLDAIKEVAA
ncbi:MAG: DUF512 domain-containing protein [Coriobacteriia bacterium]|nr:DUF512 domain-containing protein [Coriobacteriia bacterium]